MSTNTTVTATTTSAAITLNKSAINEFIITAGANPVTIRMNEPWNAVFWSWIQIPANSTWSYVTDKKHISSLAIISSWGNSVCAIYYD